MPDLAPPMHKLSSSLRTPGGITGIVVDALPGFDAVIGFYQPWADAAGSKTVEDFLREKNLVHPPVPTKKDQVFYLIFVGTRPNYPFVVGETNARLLVPGNGKRPPVEWKIPEREEPELELEGESAAPAETPPVAPAVTPPAEIVTPPVNDAAAAPAPAPAE